MNILITGAHGFIGQRISEFLIKRKINVYTIGRGKLVNLVKEKIIKSISVVK